MDYAQKMNKCSQYVEALEVERQKIQVFQRELPLCLELVSQAIDACRQQLSGSSEQTSSHGPVLEEFIPINRVDDDTATGCGVGSFEDEEEDESGEKMDEQCGKKSDWLRSVQLWNNQSSDLAPVSEKVKKDGGGFRSFNKEKVVKPVEIVENKPASSSTMKSRKEESINNNNKENESAQRKPRRCWSPELHRRFIHALQQLGGPHVATPKQIKELMKVDGLTNDEVKSHLQKYRLHMRKPSATMPSNGNQGPQFLVVGDIWAPPPEYATRSVATPTTASSGDQAETSNIKKEAKPPSNVVYAPVAKVGTPFSQPTSKTLNNSQKNYNESHCEDDRSHSAHGRARAHSSSPASSSSTRMTATASPVPS